MSMTLHESFLTSEPELTRGEMARVASGMPVISYNESCVRKSQLFAFHSLFDQSSTVEEVRRKIIRIFAGEKSFFHPEFCLPSSAFHLDRG